MTGIALPDSPPPPTTLRASVVVPTFRDWPALSVCLRCLGAQTVPLADFEIIVADNDPAGAPPADLPLPPNARILREPAPGSYAARNAGVAAARGGVLFFTDADCRPAPDWIAEGLARLDADPAVGRIGGAIEMTPQGPDWTVPEIYDRLFNLRQERYVAKGYAATANLVVRRASFDRVGPFDAGLMSSGDKEWNGRAGRAGVPIAYSDRVRVCHPARASFAELARKRSRVAGGKAALKRKGALRARLSLMRLALPPLSAFARILREPGLAWKVRLQLLALAWRLQLVELRTKAAMLAER